jgi:tetratricopeptide (TPR) repeat protein
VMLMLCMYANADYCLCLCMLMLQVLYALRDYPTAIEVAGRAVECGGELTGEMYVQLGRSLFRQWPRGRQTKDLQAALTAYRTAMKDNAINRQPLVYLELVAIHTRLGRYQDAMDTLGAFMVLFKYNQDFVMIAQYNVTVILCLAARFDEAVKVP